MIEFVYNGSQSNIQIHMVKSINAFLLLITISSANAQTTIPALSVHSRTEQQIGFTEITIDYHRPSARERKIFAGLVPYNQVWKTGGGICTKLSFSDTVLVNEQSLYPGTYSLYTIPGESQWTIILNRDTTGSYDEKNDALRFQAKPYATRRYFNALTIDLDFVPEEAQLHIAWENTAVSFKIETNTDGKFRGLVAKQLKSDNKDPEFFALAAEYYLFRNEALDQALRLVNRAISLKENSWYYSLKVDILKRTGRYAEAVDVLKMAIAYEKTNPENWSKVQFDEVLNGREATMKELQTMLQK